MIWLLPVGIAAVISHVPEKDIIVKTIDVNQKESASWKESLRKGQSIVVRMNAPYGVITMATHDGYDMYIGTISPESTTWESSIWYQATTDNGFITIGNARAIIEIVAQEDIELIGTALYVGEKVEDGLQCTDLLPGLLMNYQISTIRADQALCYVQTSTPVSLYVNHKNDGTKCQITAKGHSSEETWDTQNVDRQFADNEVQLVAVTVPNDISGVFKINVAWSGGLSVHKHETLIADKAKGGVGIATPAGLMKFQVMMQEPIYPQLETPTTAVQTTGTPKPDPLSGGEIAIIVVGVVMGVVAFGGVVTATVVIIKRAKKIAKQVKAETSTSSSSSDEQAQGEPVLNA